MIIPGKEIAETLTKELLSKIEHLITKKIHPHLAVILVGNDESSLAYINRKKKVGETLSVTVSVYRLTIQNSIENLKTTVQLLNDDPDIHGIIIQRPVPLPISKAELDELVVNKKDVDGFRLDSAFTPPIGSALLSILQWVYQDIRSNPASELYNPKLSEFDSWLTSQKILIIGKGNTGGKPIEETLRKRGATTTIADSKTQLLEAPIKNDTHHHGETNKMIYPGNFDMVISCAGKSNILRHSMVSKKTILIGVGLHTENGSMSPDYNQNEVRDLVAYYTPVPGGVGPVNVACLFKNLVQAAQTLNN